MAATIVVWEDYMKDRVLGIISIIASSLLMFSLWEKRIEAKVFPLILLIVLILLSIVLIIRKGQKEYDFKKLDQVFMNFLITSIYIFVLPYIGFVVSTTCFVSIFIIINKYPIKMIVAVILSLFMSLFLWFIFVKLFGITLPEILF
jgi:hypothetical protein